ncbi:MAG: hypothetical protein IPN86_15245 [Saprospiraceae bacterium]|nr:hypothetical protein [Saprospiraceae bacterium]
MKTIITTLAILMGIITTGPSDKQFDFNKAWAQVEKFISEGLPQSALEKVEEIHNQAIVEKNNPQLVKSIIYIARLSINTDEKGIENSIERFQKVIQTTQAPVKQITASYLAELYQRYFDNYRYEISQRSEVIGDQGVDFRTWTTQQFLRTIEQWYLSSLEDKKAVNNDLSEYDIILNKYDQEAKIFKPTLYEVLADRAFSYFQNYDSYSNENVESFQIDQYAYFDIGKKFVNTKLKTEDIHAVKFKLLKLYQEIIAKQIENNNQFAIAQYDLSRLQYVYQNATLENKESHYINSLTNLSKEHSNIAYYSEISAVLATQLKGVASDSLANVKAIKVCEDAIKKYPKSIGAAQCQNIINDIKKPTIQLFGEQVYPSKHALLFALDYNNVPQVSISVVKLGKDFKDFNQRNQEDIINFLTKAKKLKEQFLTLKASPSYQAQRQEFSFEPLGFGQYALLVQSKEQAIKQYIIFHLSDLSYVSYLADGKRTFIVSDRVSGLPIKDVNLTFYHQNYNPGNRKYDFVKSGEYLTNGKGKAVVADLMERNFKVILTKNKDVLDLNQYHYNYLRSENQEYKFAEFYTDRSIYRPGQVVYFKAILLKNDTKQIPSLLKGERVDVIFRDANYQEISKINLTSNDFGSVNGSFTIPSDKLNGNFTIEIQSKSGINGQKNIQVEEYKRPTFEVEIDPLVGEYKLNDKIEIKGTAQTLAGTTVDGAEVTYKIVRTARFPNWGWWWRMPYNSTEFIVSQGKVISDIDGKYQFDFEAIPDLTVAKIDNPIFSYNIQVDVTDQRGETRSATSTVAVGYTAFSLSSNLQGEQDLVDIKPLKIFANATNGQSLTSKGSFKFLQLKEPTNVQIKKYWDGKIHFPLSATIGKKSFPQYPRAAENDFTTWAVEKNVLSGDFTTNDSLPIAYKLVAGVYRLELSAKDKYGNEVLATQYVVVTDFSKDVFPKSDFLFVKTNQSKMEPGQKLEIILGAAEKPIQALVIIEKDGQILMEEIKKIDKKGSITLPISEAHRGGFNVKVAYTIQNRTFDKSFAINVPWTNKELSIQYETFRDKTLPGSQEEYRIKISGTNKDKVAAEMVSAMYDASLDQFIGHEWRHSFYPNSYAQISLEVPGFHLVTGNYFHYGNKDYSDIKDLLLPALIPLIVYDNYGGGRGDMVMMKSMRSSAPAPEGAMMQNLEMADEATLEVPRTAEPSYNSIAEQEKGNSAIPVRKNLKETVFFFPEMKTDAEGNVILSFTINEALTKWKLMTFAHTQDFKTGYDERFVQTQKELMVFPNAPRFVRDGDVLSFSAKVTNLSSGNLTGKANLQIWDAITMQDITAELLKSPAMVNIDLAKGVSQGLSWDIAIPDVKYSAITYRVTAIAGEHADAEENTIPVVTNRMLVTESMPLWIKGNTTRSFTFNAFKNNVSKTKKDFKYTFEYTSNPVWYAVQALPYIQQTNNVSTQALVDRMYANVLAAKIANAHPKIKAVFDQWSSKDKQALVSNLSKNEELKSAILEETPWVRQAMSESEQKRSIAVLFDLNKLADERTIAIQKLSERQLSNGGFPWLSGGRDNVFTTQNIMENIGHLYHLGALEINDPTLSGIVSNGLRYMDDELAMRYEKLKENVKKFGGNMEDDHLDELAVHYLYVKTFFKHVNPNASSKVAREYYYSQAKKYWLKRGLYTQAMIGLIFQRNDDNLVQNIVKSLREKSFSNDEMGMYWNEGNGFYWYQLPIERHALMVELFTEAVDKKNEADKMKIWLLKNKQTNHWKTSKSTAAAIYALLLQGEGGDISQWVTESVQPVIMVGTELINTATTQTESGTGYIKKAWNGDALNKEMATIKVTNNNKSIAWGAAYYQYFEQLDQIITFSDTPLKLNKKLYKVVSTAKGDVLTEVSESTSLKPGDRLKIRIELRVDRAMEYVQMKDMRASGFEPENVISEYKYQGQLGYYETTKDLATHFYFTYLPKGTFVFEYPVRVVHKGDFSGGITNIECMYAPEFSSHSEGIRVKVK